MGRTSLVVGVMAALSGDSDRQKRGESHRLSDEGCPTEALRLELRRLWIPPTTRVSFPTG